MLFFTFVKIFYSLTEKVPKRSHLLTLLHPVKSEWNIVASQLDVPNGKIKEVEYNVAYNGNDTKKLMEILQIWIDTQCSDVSWRHIITVIATLPLKNLTVANEIKEFLNKPDIECLYCEDQSSK